MSDYWARRKAQQMFEYMAGAEDAANEIASLYQKASGYVSHELDRIFDRYKRKHHLSDAEAYRLLSALYDKTSIEELKAALRAGDGARRELLAELESPAYQARLERLRQLRNQIDLTMRQVYGQEKVRSTGYYVDLANEAFYRSIFDIQQQAGTGFSFNLIDPAVIDRVINSKWSGANYSARIWRNTAALAQDLKEELLINLLTGRTDREAAEIIANKFAQGAGNARRLVRTESCNLANQMDMLAYRECGIEYYRYLATLDLRTSETCRKLDGKRFKVSEQQPGKNCPPMHPWCRSTTVCDITDEELSDMQRSARDPVTGRVNKVPADMTYGEWYDRYVKSRPEAELNEKKIRNRAADRRQYERYQKMLGGEAPENLDSFQKMKYTEAEKWGFTKLDYERRNDLLQHPEKKLPNAESSVLPDKKFTHYLFGGDNSKGLAKGAAISSRLGYDINNWEEFRDEIRQKAGKYPSAYKMMDAHGTRYEQKMVMYGKNGKPANVIVGWNVSPEGITGMTSVYLKEVKKND